MMAVEAFAGAARGPTVVPTVSASVCRNAAERAAVMMVAAVPVECVSAALGRTKVFAIRTGSAQRFVVHFAAIVRNVVMTAVVVPAARVVRTKPVRMVPVFASLSAMARNVVETAVTVIAGNANRALFAMLGPVQPLALPIALKKTAVVMVAMGFAEHVEMTSSVTTVCVPVHRSAKVKHAVKTGAVVRAAHVRVRKSVLMGNVYVSRIAPERHAGTMGVVVFAVCVRTSFRV